MAGGGIEDETAASADEDPISRDPIGVLATAAGYDDGESWWSDVIEENPAPGPVFAAVADAMAALRAEAGAALAPRGRARGAYADRDREEPRRRPRGRSRWCAAPGTCRRLRERRSLAADRELLKGRPKAKIKATWAPWTAPRLARASGYGAGVVAPGWCAHLWATRDGADRGAVWLARIARLLRERGHFVSTASVIEAQRLGTALAALRDRPAPGFEELREAAIACLCDGERAVWDDVAAELLIGSGVGSIPAATPLAPLLEDLQRQQKATRLKPEALERALTLDLRSESGLDALDPAAPAERARRALGTAGRCRAQPRHVPRELAAALGAGVRGAAGREPDLRLDHRRGRRRPRDGSDARREPISARWQRWCATP